MCLNIYTFLGKKVFWLKSLTFSNRTKCVDILMCSPLQCTILLYIKHLYQIPEYTFMEQRVYISTFLYSHRGCEMINDI